MRRAASDNTFSELPVHRPASITDQHGQQFRLCVAVEQLHGRTRQAAGSAEYISVIWRADSIASHMWSIGLLESNDWAVLPRRLYRDRGARVISISSEWEAAAGSVQLLPVRRRRVTCERLDRRCRRPRKNDRIGQPDRRDRPTDVGERDFLDRSKGVAVLTGNPSPSHSRTRSPRLGVNYVYRRAAPYSIYERWISQ